MGFLLENCIHSFQLWVFCFQSRFETVLCPRMKKWFFLILFLPFAGCRVTGDGAAITDAGQTPSFDPIEQTVAIFQIGVDSFQTALSASFAGDFEAAFAGENFSPVAGTYEMRQSKQCDDGVADLTENITDGIGNGTFLVVMDLRDCTDFDASVSGSFSVVGTFTRVGSQISFQGDFADGLNDANCDADFSGLNFFSETPGAFVVSGEMTAACSSDGGDSQVTCSWGETATDSADALSATCVCEGAGC